MTTFKTVKPHAFEGYSMSIFRLFGSGPMFHVTCGNCRCSFSKRITMISNPGLKCPECGAINIIPVSVE